MTESVDAVRVSRSLPWGITLAALCACVALTLTGEHPNWTILAAALILAGRLMPLRLPRGTSVLILVRVICLVGVALSIGIPNESIAGWYMKPAYTNFIGPILAMELAVRAWRRRGTALGRLESDGVSLTLAAGVMLMAANSYERAPIRIIAPMFFLTLFIALRQMTVRRPSRPALSVWRTALALLAIGLGCALVEVVAASERNLTDLAMKMMPTGRRSRSAEVRLTTTPRMGGVFNPAPSMERVLVIEGPYAERHIRAMAFDELRGGDWLPTLEQRPFSTIQVDEMNDPASNGQALHIVRINENLPLMLIPPNTRRVIAGDATFERDVLGTLRAGEGLRVDAYDVDVSHDDFAPGLSSIKPADEQRKRALQIPDELDRRVLALAKEVAGQDTPQHQVARIASHLRTHHKYSLQYDPKNAEPVSDFILNDRAAHCQYFAAAVVMMSRAVGIPARFVTGYYAHEQNGPDETVVRGGDAHAWAECWFDEVGWVTVDATPSGGLPQAQQPKPGSWQKRWEGITDIPRHVRDWLSKRSHTQLVIAGCVLGAIFLIAWTRRFLRERRANRRKRGAGYAVDPTLHEQARRFGRWLKKQGVTLQPQRTWREQAPPEQAMRFINAYDATRFGQKGATPRELEALLAELESTPADSQP